MVTKKMSIKGFIEGLEPDPMGRTFDNILSYSDADIENVHNFLILIIYLPFFLQDH